MAFCKKKQQIIKWHVTNWTLLIGLDVWLTGEGKQGPQDYINKVREGVNWENNQINKECYKKLLTIITKKLHSHNYRHKKTKIYHLWQFTQQKIGINQFDVKFFGVFFIEKKKDL